jgi:hypothetical protein
VLVLALLSVVTAVAGTADASTWINSGDTAFTTTTGPSTMSVPGVASLSCTSGSMTAMAPATAPGPNYIMSGSMQFPMCRLGIVSTSLNCTVTFTYTGNSNGVSTGSATLNCVDGALSCVITGTVPLSHTNATATSPSRFSWNASAGLSSSHCIMSGSVTWSPNPRLDVSVFGTGGAHPTFGFGARLHF